jgi:hypothetical protein
LKNIKNKFGVDQNAIRQKLNLVAVDPAFKLKEDVGERYIFVNKHEPDITGPEFLTKIIVLDSSGQSIQSEEDDYKNPIEGKHLIVHHNYFDSSTNIYLEIISENINNKSINLTIKQADSILKSWKIGVNPF